MLIKLMLKLIYVSFNILRIYFYNMVKKKIIKPRILKKPSKKKILFIIYFFEKCP